MNLETEAGVMVKPASVIASDELHTEVKAIVHSIRERFADYSADEIEALMNDAIRDIREQRVG